jgi:hypothetical protein
MANSIVEKIILNGSKLLVLEYQIVGDGSGEETATKLVDMSTFSPIAAELVIRKFAANLDGFSARLLYDATTDTAALVLPEGSSGFDYQALGGSVQSNAGDGVTGDIMITTVGLGTGNAGTIRLELGKKF